MSEALQAGIRRMLGVMGEGREPRWAAAYAAKLPRTRRRRTRALARLLWQEGQLGLEDVVLDALKLIGFDVYASNPEALELRAAGQEHAARDRRQRRTPSGLAAHYRLRQRIERAAERGGAAPRGLIVINGHRHDAPPSARSRHRPHSRRSPKR